jgi:hypothetical protein
MSPIDVLNERIVVETDRYRVEGDITLLPHEDNYDALYKYINRSDQEFLYLVNVEVAALDGSGRNFNYPALNLEIRHIRSVVPKTGPEKK